MFPFEAFPDGVDVTGSNHTSPLQHPSLPQPKNRHHFPDIPLDIKELLDALLTMTSDGVCLLDSQGYIVYGNPIFEKMTGLSIDLSESSEYQFSSLSPDPILRTALTSRQPANGFLFIQGQEQPAAVRPLTASQQFNGAILLLQAHQEWMALHDKLRLTAKKNEYLERKLQQNKNLSWVAAQYGSESSEQRTLRLLKITPAFEKFIGVHPTVLEALSLAAKAARVPSTVLIRGKSGTGKELVAEGIHNSSPRAQGPFIKVNCAAIPAGLLESELFGHEKGAFTGAYKKKLGKFELADQGTILLDEIGEMDINNQTKLLRVLQSNSFERVGGEQTLSVNVRVIAATNRDMEKMVEDGTFREDLYYRLNVIPICLPSLKDRCEDIPILADYFLKKFNAEFGRDLKGIEKTVINAMTAYSWPGNVRELKNIMERMVVLTDGPVIRLADLPPVVREKPIAAVNEELPAGSWEQGKIFPLEDYEKVIIKAALEQHKSYTAAAKALGITHKTVAAKAQKYGLGDWLNKWINK